jgi:hypothetical protein
MQQINLIQATIKAAMVNGGGSRRSISNNHKMQT